MIEQIRLLFHEVADLPPKDREQYFQSHHTPADLRAEVEQILPFDSGGGHLLTNPIATCAMRMLDATTDIVKDRPCGPYRLIELIGTGGMGSVYIAERADGEVNSALRLNYLHTGLMIRRFAHDFCRNVRF